jgi:hypothetical protein
MQIYTYFFSKILFKHVLRKIEKKARTCTFEKLNEKIKNTNVCQMMNYYLFSLFIGKECLKIKLKRVAKK